MFKIKRVFYKCKFYLYIHFYEYIPSYFFHKKTNHCIITWLWHHENKMFIFKRLHANTEFVEGMVMAAGLRVDWRINEETILRGLVVVNCALLELYSCLIHMNFYARRRCARKWTRKGLNAFYFFFTSSLMLGHKFGIIRENVYFIVQIRILHIKRFWYIKIIKRIIANE